MNNNDVQLWFARNKNGKIITINEVKEENKHDKYYCPLCNSEVLARQGNINSWCFAHIDKSKCSSESMYHFWIKNRLLQKGDKFIIKSDIEKEYICKDILVEQTYMIDEKEYRPDLTVVAESGETIYFEMANTNKKKIEEYLDIWIELGNIVVEVDIKTLINSKIDKLPVFKALWYNGKCFNVRKNNSYYNTIGKYKEELQKNGEYNKRKDEIKKLDWIWRDIAKYKMGEVNIEYMTNLIDSIEDEDNKEILEKILNKKRCNDLYYDYKKYKTINIFNEINSILKKHTQENRINNYSDYIKTNENQGIIDILDPTDNCFIVYNILELPKEKLVNSLISDLNNIVNYNKQKEKEKVWEEKRNRIYKEITENPKIKQYIDDFNENTNKYKLEVSVSPYRYELNNKLSFQIILTYNTYVTFGVVAIREEKEIKENYDIDNLYNFLKENISSYFSKLDIIDKHMMTILNRICEKLKNRYSKTIHNITIENKLWLEDIYNIEVNISNKVSINENFYITNNGIVMNDFYVRDKKIILQSRDENIIENYVVNKLSDKIRQQMYKGGNL